MANDNYPSIWKATLPRLRHDWQAVFTTHLAYTALGIILFTPLFAMTGRLLLSLSDQPALADQDIAWFLLSPAGLIAIILLAGLGITILGFEQASLMTMSAGHSQGLHIGTVAALRFTAVRAYSIFLFAIRLVVRVLILTLPFLAVAGAIAWYLLTDYDINYYLAEQPQEFWIAAVLIGGLLLVMTVLLVNKLLGWSLSLPLVLLADYPPAQSFSESERITQGNRVVLLKTLAIWAALSLLLGGLVTGIVGLLGSQLVPRYYDSIDWLVPVLGGVVALWMLGNFLVTVCTSGSLAYVLVEFFERHGATESRTDLSGIAQQAQARGLRLSAPVLAIALAGAAACAVLVGHWLMNGIQISDTVTVVAHRGAAGKAPENTLASMSMAIEVGADWLVIDVLESAYVEVMFIHDSDFMKLDNVNMKVWDGS